MFKSLISISLLALLSAGKSYSQSVYYGINNSGGYGHGCIFKYSDIYTTPEVVYKFEQKPDKPATNPEYYVHTDNKLYAFESSGTTPVFNCYDPSTNKTKIISQLNYPCQFVMGKPVQSSSGNLYGIVGNTLESNGAIMSYSFQSNEITLLAYFPEEVGPAITNLVRASNGKFYFMSGSGIACFNPALPSNQAVSLVHEIPYILGWGGTGDLIEISGNRLIGTFNSVITINSPSIFSYNFNTNTYTNLMNFTSNDTRYLQGVIQSNYDQKLYGLTNAGLAVDGYLYSFDLATQQRTILHVFDEDRSKGKLVQSGSKLYGSTEAGSIFCYDLATDLFEILYQLQNTDLSRKPIGTLTLHPNGKLYGVASQNTTYRGSFYSVDLATNVFNELFYYNQSDHGRAASFLLAPNNQLYGLSVNSHTNPQLDTVHLFTMNPENDQLEFLSVLINSGSTSSLSITAGSNNQLYVSSVQYAQSSNLFKLIRYDISSQETTTIHTSTDYPMMIEMVISKDNSKLVGYCLTSDNSFGLCSFSLGTNQIEVIHNLDNPTQPNKLVSDTSGMIYTLTKPTGNGCDILSIDPQSGNVSSLHHFSGANLLPNMCLGKDRKLYGFTRTPIDTNVAVAMYSYDLQTGGYTSDIGITFDFDVVITDNFFMGTDNNFHGFSYTPTNSNPVGDIILHIDPVTEIASKSSVRPFPFHFLSIGPVELPLPNGFLQSSGDYSWNLFPNPTSGNVMLNCSETPLSIRVIDLMGGIVYEISAPQNAFNTLYIDNLNTGFYHIQIDFPNETIHSSFVKL